MNWISVEDRLPDLKDLGYMDSSSTLLVVHGGAVWIGSLSRRGDNWQWDLPNFQCGDQLELHEVTHWMPLPQPPEAKK